MPLGEGDQIRLTTARYFTPTGRSIQRPYDLSTKSEYYAEVQQRFETGEMENSSNIPVNDSLEFMTPSGRKVYGGGGITPDFYLNNENTPEEEWNSFIMRSNLVDRFVFLELDKNIKKYNFDNAPKFFNEELPYKEDFVKAFKDYCLANNYPVDFKDEESLLISIKAYIALQLFDENMFTRIVNKEDLFIKKALDEMGLD